MLHYLSIISLSIWIYAADKFKIRIKAIDLMQIHKVIDTDLKITHMFVFLKQQNFMNLDRNLIKYRIENKIYLHQNFIKIMYNLLMIFKRQQSN